MSYYSKDDSLDALGIPVGGMAGLAGSLPKIITMQDRDSFAESINRSIFLNDNPVFTEVDPELKKAYVKDGKFGLLGKHNDAFAKYIAEGQNFEPADISNAGKFLQDKIKQNRSSILTVTPEGISRRFESSGVDDGVGGGSSATLWGNPERPQYGYAKGNLGVEEVVGSNPSAQFSAVDLPPEDKTDYLKTTEATEVGAKKRGWGQFNNRKGEDMHFGKEYRKAGGLTTANDIYTYLKDKGVKPPMPTGRPDKDLFDLTKALAEHLNTNEYDALESIASPAPTFGSSKRSLGQLPNMTAFDLSNPNAPKAGVGSFFKESEPDNTPFNRNNFATDVPIKDGRAVGFSDIIENFKDGQEIKGVGNRLTRVGIGGFAGTAFTSPEIAKDIRNKKYGSAFGKAGAAYGTGELASSLVNQGVKFLQNRGITSAPTVAAGFGKFIAPFAAMEAIDTASTLASGKNSRELAVESGNVAPFIATTTAPLTMAPLGHAGGHIQATVPDERTLTQIENNQKVEEAIRQAKERGSRWKLGPISLPEFGLSEGLKTAFQQ